MSAGRPTTYQPLFANVAFHMSLEGCNKARIAKALGIAPPTLTAWAKRYPEFKAALRAGDDASGKVVVSLAKAARGFSRKAVKPMSVGIGQGFTQIVDHPVVEYFPPNVTACLAWLKRHRPEIWGDTGQGTLKAASGDVDGSTVVPNAVLKLLMDAANAKAGLAVLDRPDA